MRSNWVLLLWGVLVLTISASTPAAEPVVQFASGLREREYFDTALYYLEQMDTRSDLPPDIKALVPYEKAITLLQGSRTLRNPEQQSKQLDLAKGFLEQFLKANPSHALAAQANTELAQVLIGKARAEISQSRLPGNADKKADFQKKARQHLAEARKVFQSAHNQYEAEFKKYKQFIDKKDKQFEEREKAQVSYIQAQLNLATSIYEEAETYEPSEPERKALLTKAVSEFEQIHSRWRGTVAALHARMWQGKCYEEQGDIPKALGIYNELLGHGKEGEGSASLKTIQNRVTHFKLICLNHSSRKEYAVAVQEAKAWLKQAPASVRNSRAGLGIRWEMARAMEALAEKSDTPDKEKDPLLNEALLTAQDISRHPGEFRDPAAGLVTRLRARLKRDKDDPKNFEEAYTLAKTLLADLSKKREALESVAEGSPERQSAQASLDLHLKETARVLRMAISLVGPKDDIKDVNRARYYLAYCFYQFKDHPYDAAILSEFIARRYPEEDEDLAFDAAYLAMAAYMQAMQLQPAGQRAVEESHVVGICNYITTKWAAAERANDARMTLARMYQQMKRFEQAAEAFKQVPESAPQYLEAQLLAGQCIWQQYLDGVVLPAERRPAKEKLDELQKRALTILKDAITKAEAKLPADSGLPDNLALAKFSLAQILNLTGDYATASKLMAEGPRSLVQAVAIPDGEERIDAGVKGRRFASAVFRELLRAYVGTQQLDKARGTMKDLEKLQGDDRAGTQDIYLQLGRELEKEVARLQSSKDPRLNDVLKSFDTFLEDMSKRTDQDYNTMSWIAETYMGLGEGLEQGDRARSDAYFAKAAAGYDRLQKADKDKPGFIPAAAQRALKLRTAVSNRRQKSFDVAHEMILQLLKENPNQVTAQTEAARIYEDWAARGGPQDQDKWNFAINGDAAGKPKGASSGPVWGWFALAQRLEANVARNTGEQAAELLQKYFESRYHVADCRFHWGQVESDKKKRELLLNTAYLDVRSTAMLTVEQAGAETFDRFNKLFRDIQQEMQKHQLRLNGELVAELRDLPKQPNVAGTMVAAPTSEPSVTEGSEVPASADSAEVKPKKTKTKKSKKKAPASGGNGLMLGIGAAVLLFGGGAVYMLMAKKRARSDDDEEEEEEAPPPPPVAPRKRPAAKP